MYRVDREAVHEPFPARLPSLDPSQGRQVPLTHPGNGPVDGLDSPLMVLPL
jgi:hypothetical protein